MWRSDFEQETGEYKTSIRSLFEQPLCGLQGQPLKPSSFLQRSDKCHDSTQDQQDNTFEDSLCETYPVRPMTDEMEQDLCLHRLFLTFAWNMLGSVVFFQLSQSHFKAQGLIVEN